MWTGIPGRGGCLRRHAQGEPMENRVDRAGRVEPTAEETDFRNSTESQRIACQASDGLLQRGGRARPGDPAQGHVPHEVSTLGLKPQASELSFKVPGDPPQLLLSGRHPHPQDTGALEVGERAHPLQNEFQWRVLSGNPLQGLPDLQNPFSGDLPQELQGQVQILGPNPPDGGAGAQDVLNRNQPSLNLGAQLDGDEETKHDFRL